MDVPPSRAPMEALDVERTLLVLFRSGLPMTSSDMARTMAFGQGWLGIDEADAVVAHLIDAGWLVPKAGIPAQSGSFPRSRPAVVDASTIPRWRRTTGQPTAASHANVPAEEATKPKPSPKPPQTPATILCPPRRAPCRVHRAGLRPGPHGGQATCRTQVACPSALHLVARPRAGGARPRLGHERHSGRLGAKCSGLILT